MTSQPKPDIRQFARMLRHTESPFTGKPFIPEPWQDDYFDKLFNTKRPDGLRQYQRSLLALPRKQGKALGLDTPVLTSAGWKTMGTVEVGDEVFHPSGATTKVVAVSEVMHGRPCYEVAFAKADVIVADAEHLWYTNARIGRPGQGTSLNSAAPRCGWQVRTTREIAETCTAGSRGDRNHSVAVASPLEMPHRDDLEVDPYVLGVWLGDGTSANASVTVGKNETELIDRLNEVGQDTTVRTTRGKTAYTVTLGGKESFKRKRLAKTKTTNAHLREMGLIKNKHIPRKYLEASREQRLSLLQGLMDTDGTIAARGEAEFTSTSRRLAEGFLELAIGLGLKPVMREGVARLYGRAISAKYRIQFTPLLPTQVFRLARKQARVKPPPQGTSPRSKTRQIISCEPTESVPVRCIQVAAHDGMFLVGRSLIPTHNSSLCSVMAAYEGFFGQEGGQIIMAAGDRNQANLLFTACSRYIESCPGLYSRCRMFKGAIEIPLRKSVIKFVSSEHRGKHGFNPSLVLVDEYHVQKNRDLIDVLESGMGARAEPLVVYITTAGMERIGPCYEDWQRALQIQNGLIDDPTFLPCIYGAGDDDDIFSEETWRKAQPNYGITTRPEFMQREAALAKESVAQEIKFRTLYLNQWVSNGAARFFRIGAVEACMEDTPRDVTGRPCYCGIDLSSNTDTTAFVAVWPQEDGTFDVHCMIFIPEVNARKPEAPYLQWERDGFVTMTEGDLIDYDVVREYVLDFCSKHDVRGIGIDRYNATHITTQLIGEGIPIKPFGQGYVSMNSPTRLLERLVLGKEIRLGNNRALASHLMNMQVRIDPAGNIKPTKEHSHSTQRIDAAVSLIEALGVASGEWGSDGGYEPELLVL